MNSAYLSAIRFMFNEKGNTAAMVEMLDLLDLVIFTQQLIKMVKKMIMLARQKYSLHKLQQSHKGQYFSFSCQVFSYNFLMVCIHLLVLKLP